MNSNRKQVNQHPRSDCFFCDSEGPIETHHVVPRRFDGSDNGENLVDLCPTCHRRLELLYDSRFYESLGVDYEHEESGKYTAEQIENVIVTPDTPRRELFEDDDELLKYLISEIEDEYEEGAPYDEVIDRALEDDWFDDAETVEELIETLRRKGGLYEPRQGNLRTT